jgi:hypothetical protein
MHTMISVTTPPLQKKTTPLAILITLLTDGPYAPTDIDASFAKYVRSRDLARGSTLGMHPRYSTRPSTFRYVRVFIDHHNITMPRSDEAQAFIWGVYMAVQVNPHALCC